MVLHREVGLGTLHSPFVGFSQVEGIESAKFLDSRVRTGSFLQIRMGEIPVGRPEFGAFEVFEDLQEGLYLIRFGGL